MPLGQRIVHMAPKRRRRLRDLRGELLVDAGDVSRTWTRRRSNSAYLLDLAGRLERAINTQSASAEGFGRSIWFSRYLVFAERADQFHFGASPVTGSRRRLV